MNSVFFSLAPRRATFSSPRAAIVALDLELNIKLSLLITNEVLKHVLLSLFRLVEYLEVADKAGEVRVGVLALDEPHDLVQLRGRRQRLRRRRRRVNLQVRLAVLSGGADPHADFEMRD